MKPVSFLLTMMLGTAMAAPAESTYNALAAREDAGVLNVPAFAKRDEAAQGAAVMEAVHAMKSGQSMTSEQAGLVSNFLETVLPPVIGLLSNIGLRERDASEKGSEVMEAMNAIKSGQSMTSAQAGLISGLLQDIVPQIIALVKSIGLRKRDEADSSLVWNGPKGLGTRDLSDLSEEQIKQLKELSPETIKAIIKQFIPLISSTKSTSSLSSRDEESNVDKRLLRIGASGDLVAGLVGLVNALLDSLLGTLTGKPTSSTSAGGTLQINPVQLLGQLTSGLASATGGSSGLGALLGPLGQVLSSLGKREEAADAKGMLGTMSSIVTKLSKDVDGLAKPAEKLAEAVAEVEQAVKQAQQAAKASN